MNTAVTSIGAYLDALAVVLRLRPGLYGVNVFTAPVDKDVKGEEWVALGIDSIALTVTWPRAGGKIEEEEYTIPCLIQIFKPGATDAAGDETVARAARDRAVAIYAEVANAIALDWRMSGTVEDSECHGGTVKQGIGDDGQRACEVRFELWVRAVITQS